MKQDDLRDTIDYYSERVGIERGFIIVDSIFQRYEASGWEDLSYTNYDQVLGDLMLMDSDP